MKSSLPLVLLLLGAALAIPPGHAQSAEVQQLYQQAHAAQQAGDTEKAIGYYRELLQKDPTIAPAYNNLGRLFFNRNNFPEAAAVLQKGLALNPDMAPAQVMLGASYLEMHEPGKAVGPLQLGVKGLPDDVFARQTLAEALLQLHRNEDAVSELHTLVRLDPKNQRNWYLLGKLELQLSQDDFAHMRALDPNSPLSHQLSGEIMESMQNTPGAVAEYKEALTLAPGDTEALHHLADLYWSTADWARAQPALEQYLQKKPSDCQAEWKLAHAISQSGGDNREALTEATAALKNCPDSAEAHAERARALIKDNRAAEALPDLRAAEAKSPDEPSVQFLLARAYHALGEEEKAKAATARFAQLDRAEHAAQEKHAADVLSANQ